LNRGKGAVAPFLFAQMMIGELQKIIEPAVTALGYELWGCEWVGAGKNRRLLRVYVDGENGVKLDACAKISRQISAVLDVEDPIEGRYLLEVSSPGIDRPLFTLAQYQRYMGRMINVRLRIAKEGQRNFIGILQSAADERIVLQLADQTTLELAWNSIEKAHLKSEVS
jgi:ribosome maturation factor RimP